LDDIQAFVDLTTESPVFGTCADRVNGFVSRAIRSSVNVRLRRCANAMAHKRNPINFENLEGTWIKNQVEFGKVLATMVSEHQRDLVGTSLSRWQAMKETRTSW
jgi:hypothetical protein